LKLIKYKFDNYLGKLKSEVLWTWTENFEKEKQKKEKIARRRAGATTQKQEE
jgi:hypothetical protein